MGMIDSVIQTKRRMDPYIGKNRRAFRICIALSLFATVILYIIPFIGGWFIETILDERSFLTVSNVLDICTTILLMVVFWYVSSTESKSRMTKMSLEIGRRMREEMNRKMMRIPVSYLNDKRSGDLASRFTTDLPLVTEFISTDLVGFIVHFTMIPAIMIMMLITSPLLALLYFLLIPVLILFMRHMTKLSEEDFESQKEAVASLNSSMSEIIKAHDTLRMENLESEVLEEFKKTNSTFTKAFVSSQTRAGLVPPLISVIGNSGYFLTVVIGAIMMMENMLDVGMFLTFMIYVRILNSPLMRTAQIYNKMRDESISIARVLDIIEAPEEEFDIDPEARVTDGEICVEDLSFSYEPGHEVLHSVSFKLEPGCITVLAGPTASGKTTVANLMLGFYKPDSGRITIDGHDVLMFSRGEFSKNVGAVLQDRWVFDGTIRENIIYNREGVSEEHMLEISEITGLDDFVRRLPDGYDTMIGSDRRRLPLAQRRMIAIARAIVDDPRIIILDEAVAGLDPITGHRILNKLKERTSDCTVIIISHNQALMDQADRVIRLNNGHLVSDSGDMSDITRPDPGPAACSLS